MCNAGDGVKGNVGNNGTDVGAIAILVLQVAARPERMPNGQDQQEWLLEANRQSTERETAPATVKMSILAQETNTNSTTRNTELQTRTRTFMLIPAPNVLEPHAIRKLHTVNTVRAILQIDELYL
ncbi:hypothetical protein E4U55_006850 [Claviceps digitariae]|nr:hypothetical protein E4U55_006850 [Claviceps digitariae]